MRSFGEIALGDQGDQGDGSCGWVFLLRSPLGL